MGFYYLKEQNFEESIETLEDLNEDKATYVSLNYLGQAYFFSYSYEDALKSFKKARKIKPKNSEIYNNIALCQFYLKDFTEAEKNYLKALELKKDYKKVIKRLANLYKLTGQSKKYSEMLKKL